MNMLFSQLIESGVGAYTLSEVVPIDESWKSVACGREEAGVAVGGELKGSISLFHASQHFNVLMLFSLASFLPHKTLSMHLAVADAWGSFICKHHGETVVFNKYRALFIDGGRGHGCL